MGGEGSMAYAIKSLKQNRALLKKRKFKDIKDLLRYETENTQVNFKKVSPTELFKIKQKIRKEAKQQKRVLAFIYAISILLSIVFIFFIFWWVSS